MADLPPRPTRGKQRDPVQGVVNAAGKRGRGVLQKAVRNGKMREKRLRAKVDRLRARVHEDIEVGVAKVRGVKRKHTDPGDVNRKENWAIQQAQQALHKLNYTVLEMICQKEGLKPYERGSMPSRASIQLAGHQLALAAKGLLRPEIDAVKMVIPMRPLLEEMLKPAASRRTTGSRPAQRGTS